MSKPSLAFAFAVLLGASAPAPVAAADSAPFGPSPLVRPLPGIPDLGGNDVSNLGRNDVSRMLGNLQPRPLPLEPR